MQNATKKDDTASLLIDPKTKSPLIDKQEILQQFHISNRTLQRWRTSFKLKYYKIGKKIYYSRVEIQNLIKKCFVSKQRKKKK
jgi:hypothetical protein